MAMIKRLSAVAAVIATGLLAAGTAGADEVDYLALDEASKRAIRNACGSWAYRDADRWIAPWIEAMAPLCAAEAAATAPPSTTSPPDGNAGSTGQ